MKKTPRWLLLCSRLVLFLSLVTTLAACNKKVEHQAVRGCMVLGGQCKNPPPGMTCYCRLTGEMLP